MNSLTISNQIHAYKALRQRLLESFPDLDEETTRDTLEGLTDLNEMIAAIIRSALVDEAMTLGLKSRLDDMKARATRLEERGAKKRQLALEAMSEVGLKRLEQADFTASARAGVPSLVVVAEADVPDPYWRPQAPKLDRQAVLADLKLGRDVPGTSLANPRPTLSVRTK